MHEAPHPPSVPAPRAAASRLHVLLSDRPADVRFSFEQPQSRLGVGASVASHVLMVLLAVAVMRYAPARAEFEPPERLNQDIVWLAEPGPGGGGGGGGNEAPEPPRKVELPGRERVSVPAAPTPKPEPAPTEEPPPIEELSIPAKMMAAAEMALPGAFESGNVTAESQGSGRGGGAGTGQGTGIGPGQGSGLGPGTGGGTGGGAYRPGSGIENPRVIREVRPAYTADAMRAKVQGVVWLECVVLPDGTVGDVRITRSLDPVFGLDQEAVRAARQWRFVPGTLKGQPVPVLITIELTFTLR